MSTNELTKTTSQSTVPGFTLVRTAGGVEEYLFKKNGLRVLYLNRPETSVITTNITYLVGARDEARGETGIAHMLEHMLFKPTKFDLEKKQASGAMVFERDTGCVLNANTWKDRTTYFFAYPKAHFKRALAIEAERMTGVILTEAELKPEQGNVLSEFDMYNGDPYFALSVAMVSAAYISHPYGHETIGYREDIEAYTALKLERFYRHYYRPDNAVMMVIGDIDRTSTLTEVKKVFGTIENPTTSIPRFAIKEPVQEGMRRITISRPSNSNIVSLGFKHAGFPSASWFETSVLLDVLTNGPESILHLLLVDSGKAASVEASQEPTSEENLGMLTITLSPKQTHAAIEALVLQKLRTLTEKDIAALVKKTKTRTVTDELFARTSSLRIAQELTEYVSAGKWERYADTKDILEAITVKKVHQQLQSLFSDRNLTIGYFIGTES